MECEGLSQMMKEIVLLKLHSVEKQNKNRKINEEKVVMHAARVHVVCIYCHNHPKY